MMPMLRCALPKHDEQGSRRSGARRRGSDRTVGTARDGRLLDGVMKLAGLNYAAFGNHEFDLSPTEFEQRLKESSFRWVSSNVHAADGTPFMNVAPNLVITAANPSGRQLRIGLFGLTIDSNTAKWV